MAKFVKMGKTMTYTNGATAIAAGDVVRVENVAGVAEAAIAANATGALTIEGVFSFEASAAVTQGRAVYLNASTGKVTGTSASSLVNIGVAMTGGTAADTVQVKLVNPVTVVS